MITCPNCKTIYQEPTGTCVECGRPLTSSGGGDAALNRQLMGQVDRANRESRNEAELRSPMMRRTGVIGSQVGVGDPTVDVARGLVGKLFEF